MHGLMNAAWIFNDTHFKLPFQTALVVDGEKESMDESTWLSVPQETSKRIFEVFSAVRLVQHLVESSVVAVCIEWQIAAADLSYVIMSLSGDHPNT